MKTQFPLILTARMADDDLEQFDRLRKMHFPPDRNMLRAHLTMFHRLPGEKQEHILEVLAECSAGVGAFRAEASGLRHLGAGVAFTVTSPALQDIRAALKARFQPWLNPQDMQKWQPHITIQNKVARDSADSLYDALSGSSTPQSLLVTGLDLWAYLGGPWRLEASTPFGNPVETP